MLRVRQEGTGEQKEKEGEEVMECLCYCHTDPEIKHVTPCCGICKHCGMRVVVGFMTEHIVDCHLKNVDLVTDERGKVLEAVGVLQDSYERQMVAVEDAKKRLSDD